jgi:hypothetical protein
LAAASVRLGSQGNAYLIEKQCRSGVQQSLQKFWDVRAVTAKFIEAGEQVGVSWQAIKGVMIGKLPTHNLLSPIVVKVHVSACRQ